MAGSLATRYRSGISQQLAALPLTFNARRGAVLGQRVRYFLLPITTINSMRGPAYFRVGSQGDGTGALRCAWGMMDYGLMPIALLACRISGQEIEWLSSQTDVQTIPEDIDATIAPGVLQAVKDSLESMWIPAQWVTTSNTYRGVLRHVAGLFQFAKRHKGLHGEALMTGPPNLTATLGDVPIEKRQRIDATAVSFGYDQKPGYGDINLSTTIHDVLKFFGDCWGESTFHMGVTTL